MKLILASNNAHKFTEFKDLTKNLGIEFVMQKDAGCDFEVEENGTTFEENAFIKAEAVVKATGMPAVADDSGLMVNALGGAPGVHTARYGPKGKDGTDADKYNYLLSVMENIEDRTAKFVCCICCVFPNGDRIETRGEMEGYIMREPTGVGGFGYDPVFHSNAYDKGNGEITVEQKNAISHRGKALREFAARLEEYLNGTDK